MHGIFHTYGQLRITNYPNTHVFASKTSCHSDVQLLCLGSSSWAFQSNLCIHNCWETRALQQWFALVFCTPKGKPQFQGTAYIHISRKFLFFSLLKCQNLCLNHLMRHLQSSTSGLAEPWFFWSRYEEIVLWGNCDSILQYLKKQSKQEVIRQNQPMLLFNPLHIKTFFILFICFLHKVVWSTVLSNRLQLTRNPLK